MTGLVERTALRVTPSGYVHLWGPKWSAFASHNNVRTAACGRTRNHLLLTPSYPPKAKHCEICFPDGIPT
jgi:hypothetical protein